MCDSPHTFSTNSDLEKPCICTQLGNCSDLEVLHQLLHLLELLVGHQWPDTVQILTEMEEQGKGRGREREGEQREGEGGEGEGQRTAWEKREVE